MAECIKCQAPLPEGARFCPACGKEQEKKRTERRRGNGQGTAVKRGETWTAVVNESYYLDSNNKVVRKRKWVGGFSSKKAALAFCLNYEKEKAKPKECPPLEYYWSVYLKTGYLSISKDKQCAYRIAWRRLKELHSTKVDALTISMLQDCIDEQTGSYYPARDMKTVLSHLLKLAVAEDRVKTNLSEHLSLPALNEKDMTTFSEDEIKLIWEAFGTGQRIAGCLLLMIYSGMMPGELFALKEDMVDLEKCEIIGAGKKTKKRKATPIVFPEMLVPVIQELLETSASTNGFVLGVNKWTFYDQYHAFTKAAGIRDLPLYSCRHTTATALALGNIAPSVIQEVMRHTKYTTTQRYIHPDMGAAHAAVSALETPNGMPKKAEKTAV